MYPLHHVKRESGAESLTVFLPDGPPVVVNNEHPHFAKILEYAMAGEGSVVVYGAEEIRELADLSGAVAQRFDQLSERVSVADGHVYFDGDKVDSTITQQIVRCLEDPDAGDWKPLVLFMENVAANPNEHSRQQLFDWLRDREFTITSDGCFIAFKGVRNRNGEDDYPYQSSSTGEAIVNGERFTGNIPNGVGATVEMPRSDVQHDPSHGCSTGLHVGTYKYAQGYASGALLTVYVNPRDVVSVPSDCNAEKMRVCRYVVSDDEPTPPEEAGAIAYGDELDGPGREPARLYPPLRGACTVEYADKDYFVATGEKGNCQGEFYLGANDEAIYGYVGGGCEEVILVPTEPQHGDEWIDPETGETQFYLDDPFVEKSGSKPEWIGARGRTQAEFIAEHERCFTD